MRGMLACALSLAALAMPAAAGTTSPVARMTTDEKIAQLQAAAPAIPRLGVTANWWNEGHGLGA